MTKLIVQTTITKEVTVDVNDYAAKRIVAGDRVNTSREGHGTVKEIVGTRYVKVVPDGQPHSITVCIPAHGEIEQLT